MMPQRSHLVGFGSYLPKKIVTNDDLAHYVDTSHEWIYERTGIVQRHISDEQETAVYMGTQAALKALEFAGEKAEEVDAIFVATSTPDQIFPSTAARIQAELSIKHGFAMDITAACSGFVYALATANAFILSGQIKNALVIGTEVYSRLLDWSDRRTCVLFGDGAGAVLVKAKNKEGGILSSHLHSDGSIGDILYVDGALGIKDASGYIRMNGREVFRHAVMRLSEVVDEALKSNGMTKESVNWLVPHQANLRIIKAMGKKLGLMDSQVIVTVDRHANTSAASIPLALDEAIRGGRIKKDDTILLEALGGGLTWGAILAIY
ncbi:beta-ketoacyl-ACP synthase III [Entomobacter blattae]|uniref:Beta-ketoacyl-[acyl-carrier-protein] synthase III n=1 Tax=Entomobacter blattae TaxID=2762277 RepID=A0A7H1NST8_9PROT|nr:beta-ketoacyl-ACP synthase III [Entomobacter blattae]QNT78848.1 3-oxoacyl-[acyl-carrier-protein] synthase 3 [Entomobacter blattae]